MTSRHIINLVQIAVWLVLGSVAGWAVSMGHRQHWLTLITSVIFIASLAMDKFSEKSLIDLIIKTKRHDGRGN